MLNMTHFIKIPAQVTVAVSLHCIQDLHFPSISFAQMNYLSIADALYEMLE